MDKCNCTYHTITKSYGLGDPGRARHYTTHVECECGFLSANFYTKAKVDRLEVVKIVNEVFNNKSLKIVQ